MPETVPRPVQVTVAGWLVIGGSVAVVLAAFDQIAGLRTIETREAVLEALSRPPAEELGLGLEGALSAMRVLTMVAAASATAAALLGIQVLRRSKQARLALSIVAVPLFLTGFVLGGIVPAIVVGAITMLWVQPSRSWLDGKPLPVPAGGPGAAPTAPALPANPPHTAGPAAPEPYAGEARRPQALVWASALTWFGSVAASVLVVTCLVVVLAAPGVLDTVFEQNPDLDRDAISTGAVQATIAVLAAVVVAWSAAASVFAWFALRGRTWAWVALLVCAGAAAALCLALALGTPAVLVLAVPCATAVVLLVRPEVRAFVGRTR